MEGGSDVIPELCRVNLLKLIRLPISAGRFDNFCFVLRFSRFSISSDNSTKSFAQERERCWRFCKFPMEGGSDAIDTLTRRRCVRFFNFPMLGGNDSISESYISRCVRFFNFPIEEGSESISEFIMSRCVRFSNCPMEAGNPTPW